MPVVNQQKQVGLMARVKLNPILEKVRGKIGDLVFKTVRERGDNLPYTGLEGVEPTESQMTQRERFRQAALYGKMVLADPETKVLYEEAAKAKGKPVFSLIVADFFNAPSVDEVDLTAYTGAVGDNILVRASDDFDVTGVKVSLTNSEGASIESGEAVETPAGSGRWVYTATAAVPTGTTVRIAVTATDRPGGKGAAAKEKTL